MAEKRKDPWNFLRGRATVSFLASRANTPNQGQASLSGNKGQREEGEAPWFSTIPLFPLP